MLHVQCMASNCSLQLEHIQNLHVKRGEADGYKNWSFGVVFTPRSLNYLYSCRWNALSKFKDIKHPILNWLRFMQVGTFALGRQLKQGSWLPYPAYIVQETYPVEVLILSRIVLFPCRLKKIFPSACSWPPFYVFLKLQIFFLLLNQELVYNKKCFHYFSKENCNWYF